MKVLIVHTETGSIYHITPALSTWAIVQQGDLVGPIPLRTKMGTYHAFSGVRVGKSMVFVSDGLEHGTRRIETSHVVNVTETEVD